MKKLVFFFLSLCFLPAWAAGEPAFGSPAFSGGPERIQHFDALLEVRPDASVRVTETITVNVRGEQIRRGIFRDLPQTQGVTYRPESLKLDGEVHPYFTEKQGDTLRVNFGDDTLLAPGLHTYEFTYTAADGVRFFKDYDELYWNVTGNGWRFPIYSVTARAVLPPGAEVLEGGVSLYTGGTGAQARDAVSTGPLSFKSTRIFRPGEGLTVSVAWQKGIVHEPTRAEKIGRAVKSYAWLIVLWLGLLVYYVWAWNKVGRDPQSRVVRQFEPPAGFSPAQMQYIYRMGYDARILPVLAISLVRKGVLSVEKPSSGDYMLHKRADFAQPLPPAEAEFMETLLDDRDCLPLSNTYQSLFMSASRRVKNALKAWEHGVYFSLNWKYNWPSILFLAVLGVTLFIARGGQAGLNTGPEILWFLSCFLGTFLFIFINVRFPQAVSPAFTVSWVVFGLLAPVFVGLKGAVFLAAAFVPACIFARLVRAYTPQGRAVMDQIEGFKQYLDVAEVNRVLASDPTQAERIFCDYLPYAAALGLENKWMKAFEKELGAAFVQQAAARSGFSFVRAGGFVGAFTASMRPQNSGSSGHGSRSSSGFGGGGSSGGGFGGGGGGGR